MAIAGAFLIAAVLQFALSLVVGAVLGPAEFGIFALGLAGAVLGQTFAFEWLRLAATRYHHRSGGDLARKLDRAMWSMGLGVTAVSIGLLMAGQRFMALLPLIAWVTGFADCRAALLRAEFDTKGYVAFTLSRAVLAFCAIPFVSWRFGSGESALLAHFGVMTAALLLLLVRGRPCQVENAGAGAAVAGAENFARLLRYALPIIVTNVAYLAIFFLLRAGAAFSGGMALSGKLSLALDFSYKAFTTVGTALDLVLFQRAVAAARSQGPDQGRAVLATNGTIMLAIFLPMAIGLAIVAPGLEALLVAPDYHWAFREALVALLPGLMLYALIQYGLHPHFQLREATMPLMVAGAAALAVMSAGLIGFGPRFGITGAGATFAMAMLAGGAVLVWRKPEGRFALPGMAWRLALANAAMAGAAYPTFHAFVPKTGLWAGALAGGAAYALVLYMATPARMRAQLRSGH